MKYLFKGMISLAEFEQLWSMSSLRSLNNKAALKRYLVDGWSEALAVQLPHVTQSNFNRDLAKLEWRHSQIQQYNEIIGVKKI